MKEAVKYFDSLQMVVNILSYEEPEDIVSVEKGLLVCWDLLYNLNLENLMNESLDSQKFESLIQMNRVKCKNKVSFLDVDESLMVKWVERICDKFPIYREFHKVSEDGGIIDIDKYEYALIDDTPNITDGFILPEFFIERKTELLSLFTDYRESSNHQSNFPSSRAKELPQELDTPEIRAVLDRAIDKGLMDEKGNWFENKDLLCIFCASIFATYMVKPNPDLNPDNTLKLYWKPFEEYFRIKGKPIKPDSMKGAYNKSKTYTPKKLFLIDDVIPQPSNL